MTSCVDVLDDIQLHMRNKQYDKVITQCSELFITYPQNTEYLDYLMNAYNAINDTTKMIKGVELLIKQLPNINNSPQLAPSYCILHNYLAMAYHNCNNNSKAVDCYNKIISVNNGIPDIYNNIAICHIALKEYNKAIICSKISLRLKETDSTYRILANTSLYVKKYKDSIRYYESITHPTTDDLYNTSFPYLASKQYIRGFELYENRLASNYICPQTNQITRAEVPIPYWDGKEKCNHLMIVYEQGIGDNIQYFRFIIELLNRYPEMKITYFCKNIVSHLFNYDSHDNITVIDDSFPIDLSIYDKKLYVMSLPYILKLQQITPNTVNYIVCDKTNDGKWCDKLLPFENKLKVGFMYSGLLVSYIDKQIELSDFKPICCDENIQTICLHKMDDKIRDDFSKIDFASEIFMEEIDTNQSFMDTISILRNIDVLVTIDTSIAHLAGVMGVKTLLLIGYTSEWRWFDTDDNIWYDSVNIIRMSEQKPLSDLIPRIKKLLDEYYVTKYACTK